MDADKIFTSLEEISEKLKLIESRINSKKTFKQPICKFECNPENYGTIISTLDTIIIGLNKGLQREYCIPYPKLPDTLHWEIENEFLRYFMRNNSVEEIRVNRAPGYKSKGRADLFFIANNGRWYWIEIQTTLTSGEIEKKLNDVIWCSDKNNYTEYILIFPKDFKKESLYKSTMWRAKGNKNTNKLRIMVYSDGKFETILEPGTRNVKEGIEKIFGDSL